MNKDNYLKYLSKKEKDTLKNIDKISNSLRNKKDIDFFNLSINEILNKTSNSFLDIIGELQLLTEDFQEINSKETNWLNLFSHCIRDIIKILTKKDRLIYFSFILFLISLFFYFIKISN